MGYIVNCKDRAIASLSGNWGSSAIFYLLYACISSVVAGGVSMFVLPAIAYLSNLIALLLIPMAWGVAVTFLEVSRGLKVNYGNLFKGYKDFVRIFLTLLLKTVYILLWTLLLIVPGIVKNYSYAMTEYVLADRKDLSYDQAIEESMRLMQGNKWRLFVLDLSFLGWVLLCVLTLGIGFVFLTPYMYVARAHFYADLLAADQGEEVVVATVVDETETTTV